jgi:CHAD domain-containing protein/CYTH domain-containing protein
MPLPDDLLDRPAPDAVRHVALDFLQQAAEARDRLGDPGDSEALHDFRVAIRRLRSTARAYPAELRGGVTKKATRRLRRIARATGASRDAEVQLEWIEKQRASLYSRHRAGAAWLLDRLRREKVEADALLSHEVTDDFDALHATLRKRLPEYRVKVRVGEPPTERSFAPVVAERLRAATSELGARLASATSPQHVEEAHEARIAAKRVRYLLEPVADAVDGAAAAVKQIKRLQDVLGEMHDLDVLGATLAAALEHTAAEQARELSDRLLRGDDGSARPYVAPALGGEPAGPARAPEPRAAESRDPRPGLVGLARRLRTRRDALYAEAAAAWLAGNGATLLADLDAIAATLDRRPADAREAATAATAASAESAESAEGASDVPAAAADATPSGAPRRDDVEIERKYLLRGLPHLLRGSAYAEIDQGWLPGERLVERLRRTRRDGSVKFVRTVKVGTGITRTELEEATTPELFEALWPLTRDRRVRKRRYAVPDGALTWEVDEFVDRTLVLAEVELPSADVEPTPPAWLAPYVVREVTEESEFVNVNLARPAESDDA